MAGRADSGVRPGPDPRIVAGSDYGDSDREWTRIDWRPHRRSVELPGAKVDYVEIGEGRPIVFIHGISGCWQNWLENLPHFSAGHRAIALDLPGFGSSPMPEWEIGIPAYGRLMHEFCAELNLERPTLVGNSMGGFVAAEAATTEADRYGRLVLVAAAGILNTWNPELRAALTAWAWSAFGPHFANRGRQIVSRPRSREMVFRPFVRYPNRLREDLLLEQIVGGLERAEGFGVALQALIHHDIRERLGTIEMPTLIVGGLSDRIVPVAGAISYHRRIPHSRLEIFERTGHVPQLERPLRFNALLEEFLAG